MVHTAEQIPGTRSDDGYAAAARMAHEARIGGRPDIYGIILCERIGDGVEGSPNFKPAPDCTDKTGKVYSYNSPQQHFATYTPGGSYIVDVRFSPEYVPGDPVSYWMQVISANLRPGVREPIKHWNVMGLRRTVGGIAVVLAANDVPDLRIAQPGERRRPRSGLAAALRGYVGEQAIHADAEFMLDVATRPALWIPPEGGMLPLEPVGGLIEQVNGLAAGKPAFDGSERLAQVVQLQSRQVA